MSIENKKQELWKYIFAGNYLQAEKFALDLHDIYSNDREIIEILIGVYIEQEKKLQAEAFLKKLQMKYEMYSYGLFLAARVYFLSDEWYLAIKTAKKALRLNEEKSRSVLSRIYNILGASYKNIGESAKSVFYYKKEIEFAENRDEAATAYSNYLFNLHYLSEKHPVQMLTEHKKYNALFDDLVFYEHARKNRHEKIRIGYISPDLRYHVVVFFSYAFFRYYDAENFSVFCYAKCAEDAVSLDIENKVDVWRNISGCTAAETAQLIYKDEIDILFDLSGHTKGSCLPVMAYRPAPVQISGIGYFDTTGLMTIDYFLADPYTDPPENDHMFTEKLLRLPQSHFCYVPPDIMPNCQVQTPASEKGYITFGSFNNFTKTTDEMLILWKSIMQKVPMSRLILKSRVFGSESGKKYVEKRLKGLGFFLERVEMRSETANYLEEYGDIDIALDTYPYPGGGTTCEALYMGVPVITLVGKRHGTRFGYSLLQNAGLEVGCTFSKEEYVQKAVALANDIDTLNQIHGSLRRKMQASPLMQGRVYMRDLEKLYHRIWEAFLQDLPMDQPGLDLQAIKKIQEKLDAAWIQKKWQQVVSLTKKRAAFAATDTKALCQMVWALLQLERLDEAQQILNELESGFGLNGIDNVFLKGFYYRKRGQYNVAYRIFRVAAENNNFTTAYIATPFDFYKNFAEVSFLIGDLEEAYAQYKKAWQQSENIEEKAQLYPFFLQIAASLEKTALSIQKSYHEAACLEKKYSHIKKYSHTRIRIGYISSTFCESPEFYFYYQLLAQADRECCSIYCYNIGTIEDNYTNYCRNVVEKWQDMGGVTSQNIAEQIFLDEIDILVDVSGKYGARAAAVLALQPAPVQISGWQAPASDLGQGVLRLDKADLKFPLCYTGRSDVAIAVKSTVKSRNKYSIGCFTPYALWDDTILRKWLQIFSIGINLELQFFSECFSDMEVVEKAALRLAKIGYPQETVAFKVISDDSLLAFTNLDLVLTADFSCDSVLLCHSMYMGVPVIALYDSEIKGANTQTVLAAAGMEELAVTNVESQIEKVKALLIDEDFLNILHRNLRGLMLQSDLMDGAGYAKQMSKWYKYLAAREI